MVGDRVRVIDDYWDHQKLSGIGVVVNCELEYVSVRLDIQFEDYDTIPFKATELELFKVDKSPLPLPG